jgi:hypothetical protein
LLDSAKREAGSAAGGVGGHSTTLVVVLDRRQVRRDLAREVPLRAVRPESVQQALDESAQYCR